MPNQSRIVSKCNNCGKQLEKPAELWRDGVCWFSAGFCKDCYKNYLIAKEMLSVDIQLSSLEQTIADQMEGYWAGAGCDEADFKIEDAKSPMENRYV